MKKIILLLSILSTPAMADGFYVFGGVFAYDTKQASLDYDGYSPNGYFGLAYMKTVNDVFIVETGIKHETSIPYDERGAGFNGFFATFRLKLELL